MWDAASPLLVVASALLVHVHHCPFASGRLINPSTEKTISSACSHITRHSRGDCDSPRVSALVYDRAVADPTTVDFQIFLANGETVLFSEIFRSWLAGEPQLQSYIDACDSFL